MAKIRWTGPRMFAAAVLVVAVLLLVFQGPGLFAVTQAQAEGIPELSGTCKVIKECTTVQGCNERCSEYASCSVNIYKDNLIACVQDTTPQRPAAAANSSSDTSSGEQAGTGGGSLQ